MEIEFDKEKRQIFINGEYAGYIDPSDCFLYEASQDQGDTKITVTEVIKINPPITKKNGKLLTECKVPIMILRLKNKEIK